MFDIGWSELLLIAVIALIVVGPKDLPILLRTFGRYVGMIRVHAQQFRSQVEDAIKETELSELHKEMTDLREDVTTTMRETTQSFGRDVDETKSALNELGRDDAQTKTARNDDSEA